MPERRNMCPSAECKHYGRETHFMGGCHCGTALVPFKTVDDQINDALSEIVVDSWRRMGFYGLAERLDGERRRRA